MARRISRNLFERITEVQDEASMYILKFMKENKFKDGLDLEVKAGDKSVPVTVSIGKTNRSNTDLLITTQGRTTNAYALNPVRLVDIVEQIEDYKEGHE